MTNLYLLLNDLRLIILKTVQLLIRSTFLCTSLYIAQCSLLILSFIQVYLMLFNSFIITIMSYIK